MSAQVAPQNLEAEDHVLGAMLLSPRAVDVAAETLTAADFYRSTNGAVFTVCTDLHLDGVAVDAITVIDRLEEKRDGNGKSLLEQVGGRSRVHELANIVPATANVGHYANIVKEAAVLRRMLAAGQTIAALAMERPGDTDDLVEQAEAAVYALRNESDRSSFVAAGDALAEAMERLRELHDRGATVIGVASGYRALDNYTAGFQPGDLTVLAARPSMGKALSLETEVLTPDGWTTMGALQVGDKVIGGDGHPDVVTAIFDQGERDLYEVEFGDGATVECCNEHLWLTQTRNERRRGAAGSPRPLSEIRATLTREDNPGEPNHSIPYVEPVAFRERTLPLDPYLLGLYLGDGDSSGGSRVRLHSNDEELRAEFCDRLPEGDEGVETVPAERCASISIRRAKRNNKQSETLRLLKSLGLAGVGSHEKFIPREYLWAGVDDRLALLQGLCDTDGYVTDPGGAGIEYCTVSQSLCRDVLFLVRSLGGRATFRRSPSTGAYRINASFHNGITPVRLSRKKAKWNGRRRGQGRFIRKVTFKRRSECRCITVSRGLYVVGDFVVTHNTGLALGVCAQVAIHQGLPVGLFTLEMGHQQIIQRLLAIEASVDVHHLRIGKLDAPAWDRVYSASAKIKNAPLFIDDSGTLSILELRSKARRLKARNPKLALLVVDYIQLMDGGGNGREENRVQEVSRISRALKKLARELDVPVLALSQLSRAVETRHDKRPLLSDLRESGAIEQDADLVMFLYRDEYYNPEDLENAGIAELALAKHRNGATTTVKLSFAKRYARFTDLHLPGDLGAERP